jgi:hypothetical protein
MTKCQYSGRDMAGFEKERVQTLEWERSDDFMEHIQVLSSSIYC